MKKTDPEIARTIQGAINTLEAFLKTDYTTKELYEHIGLQLHLMAVLNFENSPALFDYVKEEASFDELYAASELINDYIKWLFSPWEPEFILKLLEKFMESNPGDFRKLEVSALAYRAKHMESASQWWFNTFDAVLHFQVGNSAQFKLSKTASENASDADEIVYTFGKYRILLSMPFFFPEIGTKSGDVEFISIFEKSNYRKSILDDSGEGFDILKALETVRKWTPKEALKMLCDGTLFKFTRKRTYDRITDDIMKQKTAGRGGRSPKEIGESLRQLRLDKNMSVQELAEATGKSKEFISKLERGEIKKVYETTIMPIVNILEADFSTIMGGISKIGTDFQEPEDDEEKAIRVSYENQESSEAATENRELISIILDILPESSTEHRILTYHLQEPGISFQEIADREGMSEREIRKAWERAVKQAKTAFSGKI
jgi:transcriptional regulator with XRE-family HTH domain